MSLPSRHLLNAINARWDSAGLDHEFQIRQEAGTDMSRFAFLNDFEAAPGQPWPYCVFTQLTSGNIRNRMTSSDPNINRRHQVVPCSFKVYAKQLGSTIAKTVAGDLASLIMAAFGDDDEGGQIQLDMEVGGHLKTTYQNDYPERLGDTEYAWTVMYDFLIDLPVKVGA